MQVREVMSVNPSCCTQDTSLQEVARLMAENDCGCIPVVDNQSNKKPVGTITDRDIAIRAVAAGQNPVATKASDIMSIDIATIKPNQSLEECLKTMKDRDIRRILVVDENGSCCGIVAQADIAQNNNNPVRTTEFLREVSASSPSHNMTMSRDWRNNKSSFNVNSFLPLLIGIGSVAALSYFTGRLKINHPEEMYSQSTSQLPNQYTDAESEVNKRQQNLQTRIQEVRTESLPVVNIKEESFGRFEIKTSTNGKFHFNLLAANGEIILSSEMYNSRSAAENGIESVKKNAVEAKRYERKVNKNQEPYFALKAGNGEIIGVSETFSSETALENAISSVMKNAPAAEISTTAG
jgi:uncharacterized protein YegP (UPF0339 family)/CBS domain-containing protein